MVDAAVVVLDAAVEVEVVGAEEVVLVVVVLVVVVCAPATYNRAKFTRTARNFIVLLFVGLCPVILLESVKALLY